MGKQWERPLAVNKMSVAMITSPSVSTQMTFVWDVAETISPVVGHRIADAHRPASEARNESSYSTPCIADNASIFCVEAGTGNGRLEFINHRIGKPVRMGGVMFKLLKRYGISDQEIAEGLTAYANGCA